MVVLFLGLTCAALLSHLFSFPLRFSSSPLAAPLLFTRSLLCSSFSDDLRREKSSGDADRRVAEAAEKLEIAQKEMKRLVKERWSHCC